MGRSPISEQIQLKKGPWTPEEDQTLVNYIKKHGYGHWRTLPKNAGLQRCGKSCRLRWTNYLRPDIKRGRFSLEEEEIIIHLHSILGNKWSAIAARLAGRTDNEIKNYWNTNIRKKLLRMGIDPVTHIRRPSLLDQINISMLLGVQPLINQELIRLANSLTPLQHENPSFTHQSIEENNVSSTPFQNQFHQLIQPNQYEEIPNFAPLNIHCVEAQNPCDFTNFSPPNLTEDHGNLPSYNSYENSGFCPNNGNQNFGFVWTPLDSNLRSEDGFEMPDLLM